MNKWQLFKEFALRPRTILIVYMLIALLITLQRVAMGLNYNFSGGVYSHYNNYLIFKQSWFHLLAGKDLYILYPAEYWDLYKYSPAFALFMGSMAYLPDFAGLAIWNLLNALVLYRAVRSLPLGERKNSMVLWFILIEMITSLQSSQSNALMAGLIIGAFTQLNKGKGIWAALLLVMASFIKVYGAAGFILFLFYPDKIKFILYSILWTVLFALVPLIVTSPEVLLEQYQSWWNMMAADQANSFGFSVMGWLHSWFGLDSLKNIVTIAGIILFFIPLVRYKLYLNDKYRMLFVAHTLLWMIIFNHKAESPTFIIAVSGVAIWYFTEAPARWKNILLLMVFVFTCLSPTDIFPPAIRKELLVPYVIKVVPCIILWTVTFMQLCLLPARNQEGQGYHK